MYILVSGIYFTFFEYNNMDKFKIKSMKRFGVTKCLLVAIMAFLAPIVPILTTDTKWMDLSTPFIIVTSLYQAAVAVTAYLLQSPIKAGEVVNEVVDEG
jgi:hypothetical protein